MTLDDQNHLFDITLGKEFLKAPGKDAVHERRVAIKDLLRNNRFCVSGCAHGPYRLHLEKRGNLLVFDISSQEGGFNRAYPMSLTPIRNVMKDYFKLLESYREAIAQGGPARIETIDMGRRGLHNEGSWILQERLAGEIDMDIDTARRLFTLVCALMWKGYHAGQIKKETDRT